MSTRKNKKVLVGWAGIVDLARKVNVIDTSTEKYSDVPIFAIYPRKKYAHYECVKKVRITIEEV